MHTLLLALLAAPAATVEATDVAPVWAGHPVGFALLTAGRRQFVAFYDDQRRMTVAARQTDSKEWHLVRLPEAVGWDSHNYIALTADDDGYLHLSGNMHVKPLVYFRTRRPWDTDTFERIPHMVGDSEERCTYPAFLRGPAGDLLFTYRDGRSGSGDQVWNRYDLKTKTWHRLLDKPLTSGGGKMNAYFHGPIKGPDGFFHLCWVWRNTPDCASNHDLCYARSKDLVHWETSAGRPLALPITEATADVVDPVPPGGGIINGNTVIGFDSQKRVILSYHKYDAAGKTQLYNARLEDGRWRIYQTSKWDYRWEFGGGGSIPFEIGFGPVTAGPDGRLTQSYRHAKLGSGTWVLDEATLQPTGVAKPAPNPLAPYGKPESAFPGMQVNWSGDYGSGAPGVRYTLRWETLGSNRDRPHEGPLPPASMLRVYAVRE